MAGWAIVDICDNALSIALKIVPLQWYNWLQLGDLGITGLGLGFKSFEKSRFSTWVDWLQIAEIEIGYLWHTSWRLPGFVHLNLKHQVA